jgi:hypothetical protein
MSQDRVDVDVVEVSCARLFRGIVGLRMKTSLWGKRCPVVDGGLEESLAVQEYGVEAVLEGGKLSITKIWRMKKDIEGDGKDLRARFKQDGDLLDD